MAYSNWNQWWRALLVPYHIPKKEGCALIRACVLIGMNMIQFLPLVSWQCRPILNWENCGQVGGDVGIPVHWQHQMRFSEGHYQITDVYGCWENQQEFHLSNVLRKAPWKQTTLGLSGLSHACMIGDFSYIDIYVLHFDTVVILIWHFIYNDVKLIRKCAGGTWISPPMLMRLFWVWWGIQDWNPYPPWRDAWSPVDEFMEWENTLVGYNHMYAVTLEWPLCPNFSSAFTSFLHLYWVPGLNAFMVPDKCCPDFPSFHWTRYFWIPGDYGRKNSIDKLIKV